MNKILLQSFETGLYLDTAGNWTNRPELARSFPNTVRATEFKIHRRLNNAFTVVVSEPFRKVRLRAGQTLTLPQESPGGDGDHPKKPAPEESSLKGLA